MEQKTDVSKYITAQIPYVRKIILILDFVGCWPHKRLGFKSWFSDFRNCKLIYMMLVFFGILAATNFCLNSRNIAVFDQLRLYVMFMIAFVSLQRVLLMFSDHFCELADTFLKEIHLTYLKNYNKYAEKVHNDVHKISTFMTTILCCQFYCGLMVFNLTPVVNNYRHGMFSSTRPENGTLEHVAYYVLPFDYQTDIKGYLLVVIINLLLTHDVSAAIYFIDMFVFILLFHLWGHVKILKNNLLIFPRPELKLTRPSHKNPLWYTEEESKNVTVLLKESIEHYKLIMAFMSKILRTFEAAICVYLCYHQMTGCILLVQTSKMDPETIGFSVILTITQFEQLIQLSVIFELVGSQIETISNSVYNIPWECMDVKNRKIVLFYLMITQQPRQFKALGIIPVGVQTMASILKTSISYCMFLRTTTPNK